MVNESFSCFNFYLLVFCNYFGLQMISSSNFIIRFDSCSFTGCELRLNYFIYKYVFIQRDTKTLYQGRVDRSETFSRGLHVPTIRKLTGIFISGLVGLRGRKPAEKNRKRPRFHRPR